MSSAVAAMRGVAFLSDNRLVTGGADGYVRIWNAGGTELLAIAAHVASEKKDVLSVAVSPDGKRIATGGADGRVLVWGGDK